MKLYLKFFYCSIFLSQALFIFTVEDRQTFVQANYFFEQGQYKKACQTYQTIENKGFAILYNMSLSYLCHQDYVQALVFAQRAEKQANFRQLTMLYELFDYMKKNSDQNYSPTLYEQLAKFFRKCILTISILFLQIMILILFMMLMIIWYRSWYQIYKNLVFLLIFFLIFFGSLYGYKNSLIHQQVGIMKQVTPVYAGPDRNFYKKAELLQGDVVIIIKSHQGLYQIKKDRCLGWIAQGDVELV